MSDQRVVVVTGGGAGIGAAIAEQLGRDGAFVVTMDPLVTLDGAAPLPATADTTAGRIVAAGGSARASSVSVIDGDGVRDLFARLVDEFGRLDAVVNVAGISRPTTFSTGSDEDWRAVLAVHLDGYRNVLGAALPIMAAAGRGHVLGVTSGSGWRGSIDAGAYGCAKRAVASLTWELGRHAPPGVVVNALSPIAVTRMVTAALERAQAARPSSAPPQAGPLFGSMPGPEEIGPIGAHLVDAELSWCRGQVIFAGGSELAVVEPPRLLEVARSDDVKSRAHLLEAVMPAFVKAEASQRSGGGSNPRFGAAFDAPQGDLPPPAIGACAVVSDRPGLAGAVAAALTSRGVTCTTSSGDDAFTGVDAVVVALAGSRPSTAATDWERLLDEHVDIAAQIHADARWGGRAAEYAARVGQPVRIVTVTDATTAGGRSRAQASAQRTRTARQTTADAVSAFAVSDEGADAASVADLVAQLVCSADGPALAGAELAAGPGWFGLRSHPQVSTSVIVGPGALPDWTDDVLRSALS